MKGVSYWFWIVVGVIGGLIIFTIAYQQLVGMNITTVQQGDFEQFSEIKNTVNNLCWDFSGNKREYMVSLSERVEGIYVVSSKYEEYESGELIDMILSEEYNTGDYVCIKITDKRLKCEKLKCNTTMPFIGAVPEEFSLTALISKLMGGGKVFVYSLEFERKEDKVTVSLKA